MEVYFTPGHELPCDSCAAMTVPTVLHDPRNAGTPPEPSCAARECSVDVLALRELEACARVFWDTIRRICDIRTAKHRPDIEHELSDLFADMLDDWYPDALVPFSSLQRELLSDTGKATKKDTSTYAVQSFSCTQPSKLTMQPDSLEEAVEKALEQLREPQVYEVHIVCMKGAKP